MVVHSVHISIAIVTNIQRGGIDSERGTASITLTARWTLVALKNDWAYPAGLTPVLIIEMNLNFTTRTLFLHDDPEFPVLLLWLVYPAVSVVSIQSVKFMTVAVALHSGKLLTRDMHKLIIFWFFSAAESSQSWIGHCNLLVLAIPILSIGSSRVSLCNFTADELVGEILVLHHAPAAPLLLGTKRGYGICQWEERTEGQHGDWSEKREHSGSLHDVVFVWLLEFVVFAWVLFFSKTLLLIFLCFLIYQVPYSFLRGDLL